jgi:hypothetical protein
MSVSPVKFRLALLLAIGLGGVVSFSSARGVALCLTAASEVGELSFGRLRDYIPHAEEQERAAKEQDRVMRRTVESLGLWRLLPLLLLSSAASFVFVAALRIRWGAEGPKASTSAMLANSAMVSAVMRTIDGAQELNITRRATAANMETLINSHVPGVDVQAPYLLFLQAGITVVLTALSVAGFLFLSQYFRSPELQESLGLDDGDD